MLRLLQPHDDVLTLRAIAADPVALEPLLNRFSSDSAILPRQPDLSEQLCWADAAITGGGLIKYESAFMGVPAAAIAQNEGQDGETQVLSGAGLVFDLGLADTVSDDDLSASLLTFLTDGDLRGALIERMREPFVADPSNNAAKAILEALRH